MTDWSYSKKEALNRILRILKGAPEPTDTEEVLVGNVLSEDEALSDIAQVLAGTLPDTAGNIPRALVRYGAIWTWTGTAQLTTVGTTFSKITGSFQNNGNYYGVTPDCANDRIVINDVGTYFVQWQMSYYGSSDVEYSVEPYNSNIGIPQARATTCPAVSGSATSMSGVGFTYVSGTAATIDLRVKASAPDAWFIPWACQLAVQRVSKP